MLRSMTGQGQAQRHGPWGGLSAEIRAVNNRGFKFTPRLNEALLGLDARLETLVRDSVRRGSVQLNCSWQRSDGAGQYCIDSAVFTSYYRQLMILAEDLGIGGSLDLVRIAALPGCISEPGAEGEIEEEMIAEVEGVVREALEQLNHMRAIEGAAMQRQLLADLELMDQSIGVIQQRVPAVIDAYRDRLRGKIESVLRREGLSVEVPELLREVQLFADRSDISEEITRLSSHSQMFRSAMSADESSGRKLDFIIQEMFRETNTIGSKAADAEVARVVIEIKCALERMRELVQNVE